MSLQPSARGIDPAAFKAAFGGKNVLDRCIDTQFVLIQGAPDLVRTRT